MGLLNFDKLKQLGGNAVIPFVGTGIVFFLSFGFSWWTIPLSFIIGAGTSLLISTPKSLALNTGPKENPALNEPKPDVHKDSWF